MDAESKHWQKFDYGLRHLHLAGIYHSTFQKMRNSDDRPGKPINLYKFHKPRLHLYEARSNALKQESKRYIWSLG